ncbi:hypothetical protein HY638_04160 [Candidatus Woesearchaeota archaeon]|nr:hypothetical protein [Candidatus Woesearchaeota archaeon]
MLKTSTYSIDSHGDYGATLRFLAKEDLPRYTAMFYFPSHHESVTEVRYGRVNADYDEGFSAFMDALRGPPLEVYIPSNVVMPSAPAIRHEQPPEPRKSAHDEIEKALLQIKGALLVEEVIEQVSIKRVRRRRILISR